MRTVAKHIIWQHIYINFLSATELLNSLLFKLLIPHYLLRLGHLNWIKIIELIHHSISSISVLTALLSSLSIFDSTFSFELFLSLLSYAVEFKVIIKFRKFFGGYRINFNLEFYPSLLLTLLRDNP